MSMDEFDTAMIWLRRPMSAPVVEELIRRMSRFPGETFFLKNRIMVEGKDTKSLQALLGADEGALLVVEAVGPGASEVIDAIRQSFETFESWGGGSPSPTFWLAKKGGPAMEENRTIVHDECMLEARMPCLHGLHLRSSANLVRLAQRFVSDISIQRGRCQGDAKSVLNVLALGVCFNATVRIRARGDDAEEAANAIASYLNERANCFD